MTKNKILINGQSSRQTNWQTGRRTSDRQIGGIADWQSVRLARQSRQKDRQSGRQRQAGLKKYIPGGKKTNTQANNILKERHTKRQTSIP